MKQKKLSKTEYKITHTLFILLIIIVWLIGIFFVINGVYSLISNTQSGYLLILFFVSLISLASVNSIYNIPFKEYRLKELRLNQKNRGLTELNRNTSKEEILHNLDRNHWVKINKSTYGYQKKSLFKKKIYVITLKEYKRFQKFNESDKLYNSIVNKFSLPSHKDILKNPKKRNAFKIIMFEIAFLDEVKEEDIHTYIDEYTLSIAYKLNSTGVLYDNSSNKYLHCDVRKSNRFGIEFLRLND